MRILPRPGHQPLTSGSGYGNSRLISHRRTPKLTVSSQKTLNLMKRLLLYFAALVTLLSQSSCGYNGMVERDQAVKAQVGNVQGAYQRRSDLIPNLVNTVKGAANFEKSTLEGVIEARAKATSVQLNADQLTPENIQKFQAAQSQLSAGLGRLLAVSENYPELKANANFQELQAQIEGTENRINVERNKLNAVTNDYNTFTRSFPNNLFAGMFGFQPKAYFEAEAGSQKAPTVQF
jgi:LemA protein